MTIDVRAPDGTIYRVNTDDENVARERARRAYLEQRTAPPRLARPEPTDSARRQVGERAALRSVSRAAVPFGLGVVTQPLANLASDPARRQALGRSAQGAWRDIQQIPNLDFGRLGRETLQAAGEGIQNLPQTAGQIVSHLPQIAWEATGAPVLREEQAQQQIDLARALGGDPSQAAQQANAATGQTVLNAAAPLFGGSVPRAALGGALLTAPSALSGPGTLQERLPDALTQIGGGAGLGAALQSGANALPGLLNAPNQTMRRAQQFEQAGVEPMLAATQGRGGAPMAMAIAENPIGGNVRRNLQRSADSVRDAATGISRQYGQHGQPEQVGEAVQRGVQRWSRDTSPAPRAAPPEQISTREWSFNAKANALYEHVFDDIARDEAGHISGMTGATATADNARAVLADIESAVTAPNVREIVRPPLVQELARALDADQHVLRFNDLRRLRTWVREARRDPSLRQNINEASLSRLEGALTQDIMTSAEALGGRVLADKLRRVDQFYRAGQQRIQQALEPFARGGGRQAYDRILALAREGGRQNSQALLSLKRTLRPDEWREVSATVIDDMGRVTKGSGNVLEEGAFSIERFVTEYARLSPDGRRALFGSYGGGAARRVGAAPAPGADDLAASLDNLARVAGYLKQVRGFTNYSRSGSSIQNISTLGAFGGASWAAITGNPSALAGLAAMGLTARLTGELLTNPSFVRWLTSAARASGKPGGMRGAMRNLSRLATSDPAIAAYAAELSRRGPDAGGDPATTPPERAPALQ